MTYVRPPLEVDPPDTSSLEGRASRGLKVLAALNLGAVILGLVPQSVPTARLWTGTFNLASTLLVVLFLLEARGLDRWRSWAIAIARPLLVIIAAAGAYKFAVTILDGRFRIPYDVAIAVWALRGGLHTRPTPRIPARGLGALAGALAMTAVMLFARPVFDWGGTLDARETDLHSSLAVDCGTPDGSGVVPAVITVTYEWSWTRSSPLPDGLDAIVIGWAGDDGLGRPLYLLGPTRDTVNGLYAGRTAYPSAEMVKAIAAEHRASWRWGLELDERGYEPGQLVVTLERTRDAPPDPQPVTIEATYAHVGVWRHDAEPVTCSW